MKNVLLVLCCLSFVCLATPTAEAQCRGGSCGPAAITHWMPDQGAAHIGVLVDRPVLSVLTAPVRIVGRVAARIAQAQPVRRVVRLVFTPLRRLRGCR